MDGITDVSAVTTTLEADERVLEIIVDREKAAGYLLTETAVTGIVASQLRPSPLGTLSVEGNDVQVFIAGAEAPESIEEIRSLQIPTFQGLVQLDQIASVDEVLKPTSITSERGNRTAEVQLSTEVMTSVQSRQQFLSALMHLSCQSALLQPLVVLQPIRLRASSSLG